MSGQNSGPLDRFEGNLKREYHLLDVGCRKYGVNALMFRTAKFLFYIATLVFTVYLIEFNGVDPLVATATAILLITGPEGLETWLVHQGVIDTSDRDRERDT